MSEGRDEDEALLPLPEGAVMERLDEGLALLSVPLPEATLPDALTQAEADIALRVFEGASNRDIARARGVSDKTIANQLEVIFDKLQVSSRAELVLLLKGRPVP